LLAENVPFYPTREVVMHINYTVFFYIVSTGVVALSILYVIWHMQAWWRQWRHARQRRPGIREYAHGEEPPHTGFFVCPKCGYMTDAPCDCPECSFITPSPMIRGNPNELEEYLRRQKIFYGTLLAD
jgi:hypothetical protein